MPIGKFFSSKKFRTSSELFEQAKSTVANEVTTMLFIIICL
jgi:hypothetical protein